MTNRIRIAAVALAAVGLISAPTAASAAPVDYSRPCVSVNDLDCTLTAVQAVRGDHVLIRKIGAGDWQPFLTETTILRSLDQCRAGLNSLSEENQAQMFELQDLRTRATVAESDLALAKTENRRLAAEVNRLRKQLRSRR